MYLMYVPIQLMQHIYIILSRCLTEANTVPVLSCSSLTIVILMTADGGL